MRNNEPSGVPCDRSTIRFGDDETYPGTPEISGARVEDLGDSGIAYSIYEGTLSGIYDHLSYVCKISGTPTGTGLRYYDITPAAGNTYYLVTASMSSGEGTSGYDSGGSERDPALNTCGALP